MSREERFEKMLEDIQGRHRDCGEKMEKLRAQGKEKTATYRELLGNKLLYQQMLTLYKLYDLME